MIWYRISLGMGIVFAIASSVYVLHYPCPGFLFVILTTIATMIAIDSNTQKGALLCVYGSAMSSLSVYIFITSMLFGPGMGPPDLFYDGGPRPSFF